MALSPYFRHCPKYSVSPLSLVYLTITISIFILLFPIAESVLDVHYYQNTCPRFNDIVGEVVTEGQIKNPTLAAAVLRLFFHDCVLHGCDASILISSNQSNTPVERDHDINLSLVEISFELIRNVKAAIEHECPNVVSCSDILAAATRNLVTMVGGPFYELGLGRRDGLISNASEVEESIPRPTTAMPRLIQMLVAKTLTVQEIVALSGGHTIGFSHCNQFNKRIYNFSATDQTDPAINSKYATGLKQLCVNYTNDPTIAAFNDVMTPHKFDNMYYSNLLKGMGLLDSDQGMLGDPEMRKFVELYATNQTAFFDDFANAMKKLSVLEVKTGNEGEIRQKCDAFNNNDKPTNIKISSSSRNVMESLLH